MDKFYVTTAIPYVNAPPHIGFALEIIQADVLARYYRQKNKKTFFLTGVDEHGSKIVKTAKDKDIDLKDFINQNANFFKELTKALNISNDNFIRTSDQKKHWPVAQKIWRKLEENGDIYKDEYRGLYCVGCEAFIAKKDLVDGKCPEHDKEPEKLSEENYFFRSSKYLPEVKKRIEKDELEIVPEVRKNEILSLMEEDMGNVSFSRPKKNLPWGIPVPGDPSHVMYVWCEALTNYLSGIDYPSEKFKKFWPADVQVIGKGILRFHAAVWPAMLLSLGLPLPKKILVHGYVTSEGEKMSKSLGNVVDPFKVVQKYGTDAVRYYLLREIPTTGDGDFSWQRFKALYRADLANDLGNLVKRAQGILGDVIARKEAEGRLTKQSRGFQNQVNQAVENFQFNQALKIIWQKIAWANKFINQERLWESKDKKKLGQLKEAILEIAQALKPFLPETSAKIFKGKKEILFPKI